MPLLKAGSDPPHTRVPSISVVIPAYNAASHLQKCLAALDRSTLCLECIVVDDGSQDNSAIVAGNAGALVVQTGGRKGPAHARNLGAAAASTDLLFFIDADVCVYPHTVERVVSAFQADPQLDALIGSYDDSPERQDFISQYRNLLHHFTHQQSDRQASTFWSGCGAIRKRCFDESGGFDISFRRPAIEDIEFGYRLRRKGRTIVLDHDLQVKHLKEWSFPRLIRTDVLDRAIPWTELILRESDFPDDLNINTGQRLSVALVFVLVGIVVLSLVLNPKLFLPPLLVLFSLLLGEYQVQATFDGRWKATVVVALLTCAVLGVCLWGGQPALAVCYVLVMALLTWRRRYWSPHRAGFRWGARLCGVAFTLVTMYVATYLQWHVLAILLALVFGGIVLLNLQFYLMLASRRGKFYALAAIPFHLLFHFYSGIGFIAGLAKFIAHARVNNAELADIRQCCEPQEMLKRE